MSQRTYRVKGMDCAHCAQTIEKGVSRLDGVEAVQVNFTTGDMHITGGVAEDVLRERVEALGYQLDESRRPTENPELSQGGVAGFLRYLLREQATRFALAGGALLALGLLAALVGLPVAGTLYVLATVVALFPVARSGLRNLWINRDFNINLLMTIAAVGALIIGETAEAATVIFLFAVGEAMEGYTADRARDSLRGLMALAPATAIRLRRTETAEYEEVVPVETLAVGDLILVKPGERLPMDGQVVAGAGSVDQAAVTGESVPVYKQPGDRVYAGTLNGANALEIEVTHTSEDNTVNRIIRMVEEAQNTRAPSQRLVDQFARIYTPAVVGVAALVATVPPLFFDQPFWDTPEGHGWLYRALALLVISCPCSLVISTPVTVISAITRAARRGVLIKGGAHLEALASVRAFAFDKTGTLTEGRPVVTMARSINCTTGDVCALCDDVLALAAAVERRSAHPLAGAVVSAATQRGIADVYPAAEDVETLAGRGLQGRINGKLVTVGSHSLFEAEHPHTAELCRMVDQVEAQGQTAMLLCDGDQVRGFIAVADEIRPSSRAVVRELRELGQTTVMLTGDNAVVAEAIGKEAGVDSVRAGLLPDDKVAAIQALRRQIGPVAMVGDGINDTPALAAATVGIAMGGAGSAQALETADLALMADDLTQLPFALRLARFTRRVIGQNVVISMGVKLLFVVLALFGATSLWLAVLADVGMLMLVTLNGLRPRRFA
ncbi:MAG: cation-translocating P-type ATPase [Chloroflexota bacterium]